MHALTAMQPAGWALLIAGALVVTVAVAVGIGAAGAALAGWVANRRQRDRVDEQYRTAQAALWPDAADLPPAGCRCADCDEIRDELAHADELAERLITETELALRNEAERR